MLKKVLGHYFSNNKLPFELIALIFVGLVCWSLTMVRSNLNYNFGYGYWGANAHDGIWHIALGESLKRGSLVNPIYSGENLKNYHIGFDLILAVVSKLTGLNIGTLYFQIFPLIFSVLIGLLTYNFVFLWRNSIKESLWATFFVYFSGSFGFIITFLRDKTITGESMFWSQQSMSTLINPPFALSLIFVLAGAVFLTKFLNTEKTKYFLMATLFFGLLIQIKVYAGLLVLGGLFVLGIYKLLTKGSLKIFYLFLLTLFISILLFIPLNGKASGSIVWQPFWFLETLMSYSDRLGWNKFYSAMTTYKMGNIWIKEILAYGLAFVIFILGNMGGRIIGFDFLFKILKRKEKLSEIVIFVLSIMFFAVLIPIFFVQRGTPWNTIQFFYYYLFFFSILAGISVSQITNNLEKTKKTVLLMVVLLFTIFSGWSTLQHYLPRNPQAKISNEEVEALKFLEKQPFGIVFTYSFDSNKAKEAQSNPPRPLIFYDSTAYVSAFAKKDVFLEDEVNLNILGYDWKTRKEKTLWFASNLDEQKGKDFLKDNNIKYLYLVKNNSPLLGEKLKLGSTQLGLKQIFENKEVIIYVVNN